MAATDRSLRALAVGVAAATGTAFVASADLARPAPGGGDGGRAFHAVTGGLGTGFARHLGECAAEFDARVADDCPDETDGTAAGRALCPVRRARPAEGGPR